MRASRYAGRHYAPRRRSLLGSTLAARHIVLVVVLVAAVATAVVDHGDVRLVGFGPDVGSAHAGAGADPVAGAAPLEWRACGAHHEECASVRTPLDYAHPGHRSIDIAIDRFKAAGSGPWLGVLLVNPGGPGGSGIEMARDLQGVLPPAIRDHFDLIGFDPRGVGKSAPVRCPVVKIPDDIPDGDPIVPRTSAERDFWIEDMNDLADDCAEGSDGLLPYVGTEYAARDIDAIRAALGQRQISYLGFSYGTVLGATYLSLYPDRVRAMVLDGVAPADYAAQLSGGAQAKSFHDDLNDFLAWCVTGGCPLGDGDVDSARADLAQMIEDLADAPMDTTLGDGDFNRQLRASDAFAAVTGSMYVTLEWPRLKKALAQAKQGDGTGLLALADSYQERDKNGVPHDNMAEANVAIHCADDATRGQTAAQAEANATAWAAQAPLFGPVNAWDGLMCRAWTPTATPPVTFTSTAKTPPFPLVGATGDPATPYVWAQQVARQFSSARLLTRDGDGHTSYLRGSDCIDSAIDAYLLHQALPPPGKTCASAPLPAS